MALPAALGGCWSTNGTGVRSPGSLIGTALLHTYDFELQTSSTDFLVVGGYGLPPAMKEHGSGEHIAAAMDDILQSLNRQAGQHPNGTDACSRGDTSKAKPGDISKAKRQEKHSGKKKSKMAKQQARRARTTKMAITGPNLSKGLYPEYLVSGYNCTIQTAADPMSTLDCWGSTPKFQFFASLGLLDKQAQVEQRCELHINTLSKNAAYCSARMCLAFSDWCCAGSPIVGDRVRIIGLSKFDGRTGKVHGHVRGSDFSVKMDDGGQIAVAARKHMEVLVTLKIGAEVIIIGWRDNPSMDGREGTVEAECANSSMMIALKANGPEPEGVVEVPKQHLVLRSKVDQQQEQMLLGMLGRKTAAMHHAWLVGVSTYTNEKKHDISFDSYYGPLAVEAREMLLTHGWCDDNKSVIMSRHSSTNATDKIHVSAMEKKGTYEAMEKLQQSCASEFSEKAQTYAAEIAASGAGHCEYMTLRIEVCGVLPVIWREIKVRGSIKLHQFHDQILCPLFNYTRCYHGYAFQRQEGEPWLGEPDSTAIDMAHVPFYIKALGDCSSIMLSSLITDVGQSATYLYDFGDWIKHQIICTAVEQAGTCVAEVVGGECAGSFVFNLANA